MQTKVAREMLLGYGGRGRQRKYKCEAGDRQMEVKG